MRSIELKQIDLTSSRIQIIQSNEILSKPKIFTATLLLAIFTAMIGTGAQYGYALGVMNAPSELIKIFAQETYSKRYNSTIDEYQQNLFYSIAISVLALGGIVGGSVGIPLCNRVGRKTGLFLNNIPVIIGSILMMISKPIGSFEVFILGRVFVGFSAGFGIIIGPLYITEIVPIHVRGAFTACFQLFAAIALLLAQILGLDRHLGQEHLWNYLFIVPIVFSLIQCVLLVVTPETPKYLLQKARRRAAERAIKWFRWENNSEVIGAELQDLEIEVEQLRTNSIKITLKDLCRENLLRKCLLISLMTHVAQHFTGSFIIFYFGDLILHRANLKIEYTSYAMISCGITFLAVSISLGFLLDKVGRRSLFLYGLIGMTTTSSVIGITILKSTNIPLFHMIFLKIFALMAHVGFCAMGPSAIPWMLSMEMFSPSEHSYVLSLTAIINWLSMFFVVMSFVPLFYTIGALLFLLYATMSCTFWLLAYLVLPETRRKTSQQVQILVAKGTVYKTKHQR